MPPCISRTKRSYRCPFFSWSSPWAIWWNKEMYFCTFCCSRYLPKQWRGWKVGNNNQTGTFICITCAHFPSHEHSLTYLFDRYEFSIQKMYLLIRFWMLMSLLFVYILSMGAAEMAVNASFLIHLEQGDPHANFSLRHRYSACTFFLELCMAFYGFV